MDARARLGQTIGGCRLERLLGQGAFGAVFQATQLSLERQVAVKILTIGNAGDPAFQERFIREARVVAALDSVNVIRVYELGRAADGQLYIVMELVDGVTVDSVIHGEGAVDETRAATIAYQAALGLAAAAERGIIHRDVKPANLMMTRRGVVKVADFGLAKAREGASELTQAGTILGTPLYMAPEVARGQDVTPAADVYSLGVTLYQLLTGDAPFKGATAVSILYQHVNSPVPDLRTVRPGISEALVSIVERAMAKQVPDRFPSAIELAAALGAFLDARNPAPAGPVAPRPDHVAQTRLMTTGFETMVSAESPAAPSARVESPPAERADTSPSPPGAIAPGAPAAPAPKPYQPWGGPAAPAPLAPRSPSPIPRANLRVAAGDVVAQHRAMRPDADLRALVIAKVDRVLAAGKPSPSGLEIDAAFGHFVSVITRFPHGNGRRLLDRLVGLVDTPAEALELVRDVRERLKQATGATSMRERFTLRALIHVVGHAPAEVDRVSEETKTLLFDVSELVRPGTICLTPQALERLDEVTRARLDLEEPRTLRGRSGALAVIALKLKPG